MLSIQEISDRMEIQQLLTDYSTAVDSGHFDDLDRVFIPEARIDYSAMGGIVGNLAEVTTWLGEVLPSFTAYCHLLGNHDIGVDGDTAHSRTLCLNPMQTAGSTHLLGLWYRDEWQRTPDGWRITARSLERCFDAQVA